MSNSIYIEHNPFTIQTIFEINGHPADNISYFEHIRERRLQLWVEQLFPELYNIFNGDAYLNVTFKGVETDFLDIQSAAEQATEQGMKINLTHIECKNSENRLNEIEVLMKKAEKHPIFSDKIRQSKGKLQENLEAALNKDFDVYVAATMSAGKSTLINAMLGCDLLPAANEATTATIAQITDNDEMPVGHFEGSRINKENQEIEGLQVVNLDKLKDWNSKPDTKLIKLTGNILGIKERESVRLVLTDTPGPNNSQDPEHSRTTLGFIQDSQRNPLILYILNATQLGTTDDQRILCEIAKIMQQGGKQSKDRFIFVVNKMDQFDPESGENVEQALERVRQYLSGNGIEDPLVYPVSANLTRLLRKRHVQPDSLTRKERGDLAAMEDLFSEEESMDFVKYMPLTSSVRAKLADKKLPEVLRRSGLPAIETMIDEYIDKYNFPNRVNRAYQALRDIIKIAGNESQLNADLQHYLDNLSNIESQIKALKNNKDIGAKAKAKMDRMITPNQLLSREALNKFNTEEAEIRKLVNNFQDDFLSRDEEISAHQAKRRLARLEDEIVFQSNRLINSLENILRDAEEVTRDKLTQVFEQYIKDLFEDIDIPMPIVQGLKTQISSLSQLTSLGLQDYEIQTKTEQVKTGTREESYRVRVGERSTSKWWNPFSWGSKEDVYETRSRTVDVYEDRTKEVVDLEELWENREREIMQYFNKLVDAAKDKLEEDITLYAKSFSEFMEQEFQVKFEAILNELSEKLADKAKIEAQAKEAEEKLKQIREFADKLDSVLAL